jgi:hypothetical protein
MVSEKLAYIADLPKMSASGDGHCADRFGAGRTQDEGALVQGRPGGQDIVEEHQMFAAHIATLAQRECVAQVLHSFLSVVPRLSVGVSSPFKTAQDRKPCPFGESFGESLGLVESAFSESSRVKRHRDQIIRWTALDASVLHGFEQKVREHTAQIKLAPVLEAMDQLSQYALCLIGGYHAIKSRRAIFAVRAGEFSRNDALERPGATSAEWCPDTRRRLPALPAEEHADVLRLSAPNTIGGIEQLKQRIKQTPNRISHANKLSKLKTKVTEGSGRIRTRW